MGLNPRGFTGKMSDNDIRLLRIFCTVTGCGGFAAAESELQLGLPSISRYIKDLETRLGVQLCRRGRVGFSLTDQGHKVYLASLQLIADLDRFEADLRTIHSDLTGTLNIGIIDTLITDQDLRIPEIVAAYKKRHPQVVFRISTTTSNLIEQSVLDGTLDGGITIGRRRINQLDCRPLHRELTELYCAEGHPLYDRPAESVTVDDISKCDYVGYSFLDGFDRSRMGILLNSTASVDCMEAIALLVSSGCFIGTLPAHYVRSLRHLKKFRSLMPDDFSFLTDIDFITRRGTLSPLVRTLVEVLDRIAPTPPAEMRERSEPALQDFH